MKQYVALLRGINVGGNTKIDMKELKIVFETAGFHQVSTYINSGNVLFGSTMDQQETVKVIEAAIQKHFQLMIPVLVRDDQNIAALCAAFPGEWTNDDTQKTDILFLGKDYDRCETIDLIPHDPQIDTLIYASGAIGWNVSRADNPKSGMRKFIGTTVYKNMTARNINTLRKLNDLLNNRK